MMARLKVLIDRIGLDEFRTLVDAELEKIGPIDPTPYIEVDELLRETPPPAVSGNGAGASEEFHKWRETNVEAQRQEGYYSITVKPERGNLDGSQFRALADMMRRYTGGRARATQEQNLVLRYVPEGRCMQSGRSSTGSASPSRTLGPSPTWCRALVPIAASWASPPQWAWPRPCGTRWTTGPETLWTTRE